MGGGGGSDGLVVPELGVAPLEDSGTDLEDKLPTPNSSPSTNTAKLEVGPAPRGVDLELARALLEVGVLPSMVTPIIDPVVEPAVTPALYPVPPIPVLSVADPVPVLVASPLRQVGGSPVLDQSLSHLVSPPGSGSEPLPSRISPSLRTDDVSGPPSVMAPMDQYCRGMLPCFLGSQRTSHFPFLPAPLTPRRIIEKLVHGSVEGSPTGEPVAAASLSMLDLSREGPFDVHQDSSRSGASPRVLDNLRGCQYRMTSYDEDTSSSEFNPAYGIHLHDPRLLEYVGAPESARLLSRSPEYWLHHMGHEKTLSAVLQLQHDAGLILSNLQVLQQFVTSLNRMSSEVMRGAFDQDPFPSEVVQTVAPAHRVRDGRRTIWRPWDCGVHPVCRGFMAPCRRRRATRACLVLTAFRISHSSSL